MGADEKVAPMKVAPVIDPSSEGGLRRYQSERFDVAQLPAAADEHVPIGQHRPAR
jgi:hypothetical protein